jgi:hypothetical protein
MILKNLCLHERSELYEENPFKSVCYPMHIHSVYLA